MKVKIKVAASSSTEFDRKLAHKGSYVATLNDNKKWELAKIVKNTTSVIEVDTKDDQYEIKTASASKWLRNLRKESPVTDKTDKDKIKKYWKGEHGLRSLYSVFKEANVKATEAKKNVKESSESVGTITKSKDAKLVSSVRGILRKSMAKGFRDATPEELAAINKNLKKSGEYNGELTSAQISIAKYAFRPFDVIIANEGGKGSSLIITDDFRYSDFKAYHLAKSQDKNFIDIAEHLAKVGKSISKSKAGYSRDGFFYERYMKENNIGGKIKYGKNHGLSLEKDPVLGRKVVFNNHIEFGSGAKKVDYFASTETGKSVIKNGNKTVYVENPHVGNFNTGGNDVEKVLNLMNIGAIGGKDDKPVSIYDNIITSNNKGGKPIVLDDLLDTAKGVYSGKEVTLDDFRNFIARKRN